MWVWMSNEATGGVTRFPEAAREAWEARGWVPCPEPAEEEDVPGAPASAPVKPSPSGEKKENARG